MHAEDRRAAGNDDDPVARRNEGQPSQADPDPTNSAVADASGDASHADHSVPKPTAAQPSESSGRKRSQKNKPSKKNQRVQIAYERAWR